MALLWGGSGGVGGGERGVSLMKQARFKLVGMIDMGYDGVWWGFANRGGRLQPMGWVKA